MYSSAAVNSSPSPSTGSRHRSHVSTRTSWPRPRSARASAIAGNAWPASPNAATRNRRPLTANPVAPSARGLDTVDRARYPLGDATSRSQPGARLRLAVETLPRQTREAMLRGIDANPIIVGAYVDPIGRHLPDARRAPKRRPHQRRHLRPRLGQLHPRQAPPPRHPPRGPHAPLPSRGEPRGGNRRRRARSRLAAQIRAERASSPPARPSARRPSPPRYQSPTTPRSASAGCAGPGLGRRAATTTSRPAGSDRGAAHRAGDAPA